MRIKGREVYDKWGDWDYWEVRKILIGIFLAILEDDIYFMDKLEEIRVRLVCKNWMVNNIMI